MDRGGVFPLHVELLDGSESFGIGAIENAFQLAFLDGFENQAMLIAQLLLFLRIAEANLRGGAGVGDGALADAVDRAGAERLLRSLSGAALLEGVRGRPPLDVAAKELGELMDRWRAEQARAAELSSCAADLRDWARRLNAALDSLDRLATELEQQEGSHSDAATAADETERAAALAREERESAEASWGTLVDLAGAQATARRLPGLRQQFQTLERQLGETAERRPRLQSELQTHRAALESATDAVSEAEATLSAAEQRRQDLEHADKAAALSEGLSVGDPCPVCGQPLDRVPEHPGTAAITAARQAARAAQQGLEQTREAVRQIERKIENTERDIQEVIKEHQWQSEQLTTVRQELEEADHLVRVALRGLETEDPASALQQRIEQLNGFSKREQTAAQRREQAARKLQEVAHAGEMLLERLAQQRLVIEEPGLLVVNRAACLEVSLQLPETPAPGATAHELTVFGRAKTVALAGCATTLETKAHHAAGAETALLHEALANTADLVEPAQTLAGLAERVDAARGEAARTQATASQQAESLAIRLEHRHTLEAEIKQLEEQAGLYQQLATDLRGDRLIWFLQDEALKLLAAAGSEHLLGLSEGRYGLRYEREFFVVDTWNGDEERSVKTLSGGETFLASLALALALSEQVRTLSVSERARLDSLFLDEGFGSLDSDALSVVTDAIERLGGDGRMVGVITHVRELAENFERIEVEKSPRGSHLRRVAA